MEKFLIKIKVIQKKEVKHYCTTYHYRLNPFNPLSYIIFVLVFFFTLFFYGVIGAFEYFIDNHFKWG